ncbi:MAG: hypothetical protein Q9214_007277 [Letrouitia sp. 1 TL-2023]
MHSSLIASTLFAALAAAVPLSKAQVNLQFGISVDGDDATTRQVPFGKLSVGGLPKSTRLVVGNGIDAPIADDKIICQAFADAAGTQKVGTPFDNVLPGITVGDGKSLVTLGSVFCSDAAGVAAFSSASSGKPTVSEVTIQLEFDGGSGAVQRDVPVNGKLTPYQGPNVNSGFILAVDGKQPVDVTCETFAANQKKVGVIKGDGSSEVFDKSGNDVAIEAFKCASA